MPDILSSITTQIFHKFLLQIMILEKNNNNAELEEIHEPSPYLSPFYLT